MQAELNATSRSAASATDDSSFNAGVRDPLTYKSELYDPKEI